MTLPILCLKKSEDKRIRNGHPWIYSNEVDTKKTPLKNFKVGEVVIVHAHDGTALGVAYINPHSLIAARLFSRDPKDQLNTDFFVKHLKTALKTRENLFAQPFYRLIFGESDQLPGMVIDRFGAHLVIQINTAGMEQKIAELVAALKIVIPDVQSILLRNDSRMRTLEGLESEVKSVLDTPPETCEIEENHSKFLIPLWQGQKTGWFYDHRMNRARLKNYVSDKRVLDVFSYLGGWGIQAAVAGAKTVTCIESSTFAADFIAKNAALNQVTDRMEILVADAFQALKELVAAGKQYDVIILDPPAFIQKAKDRKEGLIAYQRLNEWALKLLSSEGVLISCSCSMHLSMADLGEIIKRAATRTQRPIQVLERGHQGPDHPLHIAIPETDYLKAMIVRGL